MVHHSIRSTIAARTMMLGAIALLSFASIGEAQRGDRQRARGAAGNALKPVLVRDDNAREWVIRVESRMFIDPSVAVPNNVPSKILDFRQHATTQQRELVPGHDEKIVSMAYPLPMSFAWGGTRPETVWARLELDELRSDEAYYLEPIDDGTTNLVFEMPRFAVTMRNAEVLVLPVNLRMMFVVQSYGVSAIDEALAIEQYAWPPEYPPSIARYLEPEPFIESEDPKIKAFLRRATRNRSPKSVAPYQLAKHLAAEVAKHGSPQGPYHNLLFHLEFRAYLDDWKRRATWINRVLWPEVPFALIHELGRRKADSQLSRTMLRGEHPGITAPPETHFFQSRRNTILNVKRQLQTDCFPGPGFPVQSAADAVLGKEITDEGTTNLLIALYRAAGIPARLTVVLDQRAVLDAANNRFEVDGSDFPGVVRGTISTAPVTYAIFRPIVEFWLTDERGASGEWIPVDIVTQRSESNTTPPINEAWEHFGRLRDAEYLIAVAHHWVAPGHAHSERPHLWGIWPSLAGFYSDCSDHIPHLTCIWANERANTGEVPQSRERLIPELTPR